MSKAPKPKAQLPVPKDTGKPAKPPTRAAMGQSFAALGQLARPTKKQKG